MLKRGRSKTFAALDCYYFRIGSGKLRYAQPYSRHFGSKLGQNGEVAGLARVAHCCRLAQRLNGLFISNRSPCRIFTAWFRSHELQGDSKTLPGLAVNTSNVQSCSEPSIPLLYNVIFPCGPAFSRKVASDGLTCATWHSELSDKRC